jgi:hypothetical protein
MKGLTMAALLGKQIQVNEQPEDEASYIKNVRAGRKANAAGNEWQARLDDYHNSLIRRGMMAKIFRQYPPMRAIYMNNQIVWKAEDKGPCDYALIFPSGLAGLYDAKSSNTKNGFSWPKAQRHQLDEMRSLHLVTKGRSPAFAMVNWVSTAEVRMHPIIRIDGHIVRREDGILCHEVNWLPVVLAEWNIKRS